RALGAEHVTGPQLALGVDLAAPRAHGPGGEAHLVVERRGWTVVDREPAGHARLAGERLSRAEHLVERGGDEPAVDAAGRPLVGGAEGGPADELLALQPQLHRRGARVGPAEDRAVVEEPDRRAGLGRPGPALVHRPLLVLAQAGGHRLDG